MPSPAHSAASDSDTEAPPLSQAHTFPPRSRSKQPKRRPTGDAAPRHVGWVVGKRSVDMLEKDKAEVIKEMSHLEPGDDEQRSQLQKKLQELDRKIQKRKNEIHELEMEPLRRKEEDEQHDREMAAVDPAAPAILPFLSEIRLLERERDRLRRRFFSGNMTAEEHTEAENKIMPTLNDLYKEAEDAYQETLKQPLSSRALDRKIKKVADELTAKQEEYEVKARVARPLSRGDLQEHIHYLKHDGYPHEVRIDAPTRSSTSRVGRAMERMNLRGRISRSRSRRRDEREKVAEEEEELSRIPHVGYRAGLMYYGRAY